MNNTTTVENGSTQRVPIPPFGQEDDPPEDFITTNLGLVFKGISSVQIPEAYIKATKYLRKLGVPCKYYHDIDFNTLEMMDAGSPLYEGAQCRIKRSNTTVEEYKNRFDGGEELVWPPIGFNFEDGTLLAFGNHRVGGKRQSTNSCGRYILVDPANTLSESEKYTLLLKLASFSNVKERLHQDAETMDDVGTQVKNEWGLIKNVMTDGSDTSPITADHRKWKQKYDSAKDPDAQESVRRKEWFPAWMNEAKGNTQFTHYTTRGVIYKAAFGDERPSVIAEWTNEELTKKFDKHFPGIGFDPSTQNFDTKGANQYHRFQPWGGKGAAKAQGNAINNLTWNILRSLHRLHNKPNPLYHVYDDASIILCGESGVTSVATRKKGIEVVLKDATVYNKLPGTKVIGAPIIRHIFFPQLLRSMTDSEIDRDYAYKWNYSLKQYEEVEPMIDPLIKRLREHENWEQFNKLNTAAGEAKSKTIEVLVETKECCKCHNELSAEAFNRCAPPNSSDGLQPACRECHKTYQSQQRNKKRKGSHEQ